MATLLQLLGTESVWAILLFFTQFQRKVSPLKSMIPKAYLVNDTEHTVHLRAFLPVAQGGVYLKQLCNQCNIGAMAAERAKGPISLDWYVLRDSIQKSSFPSCDRCIQAVPAVI